MIVASAFTNTGFLGGAVLLSTPFFYTPVAFALARYSFTLSLLFLYVCISSHLCMLILDNICCFSWLGFMSGGLTSLLQIAAFNVPIDLKKRAASLAMTRTPSSQSIKDGEELRRSR